MGKTQPVSGGATSRTCGGPPPCTPWSPEDPFDTLPRAAGGLESARPLERAAVRCQLTLRRCQSVAPQFLFHEFVEQQYFRRSYKTCSGVLTVPLW